MSRFLVSATIASRRVATHQFIVHQVIVAEEHRPDGSIGDDPGEAYQHLFLGGGEGGVSNSINRS